MKLQDLAHKIKIWGQELGFNQVGITDCNLSAYQEQFLSWLKQDFHGEMDYLQQNLDKRFFPEKLVPGTKRIIMVRMNYLPPKTPQPDPAKNSAKIAFYALGRDYHKFMRKKLKLLALKIQDNYGPFIFRPFADSAPVMEKPLAEKAGLGWIGKNTLLINPKAGSWFFLGSLFVDIELPIDKPHQKSHCGSCTACINICPTGAIVAPYILDARKCIAYLTIEHKGSIPIELRTLMGTRIFGCDDCQLICPWNKFAKYSQEDHFTPRIKPDGEDLIELFNWSEKEFLEKTQGSAIRRTGYKGWIRNIAVALGNIKNYSKNKNDIIKLLNQKLKITKDPMLREHITWALNLK